MEEENLKNKVYYFAIASLQRVPPNNHKLNMLAPENSLDWDQFRVQHLKLMDWIVIMVIKKNLEKKPLQPQKVVEWNVFCVAQGEAAPAKVKK